MNPLQQLLHKDIEELDNKEWDELKRYIQEEQERRDAIKEKSKAIDFFEKCPKKIDEITQFIDSIKIETAFDECEIRFGEYGLWVKSGYKDITIIYKHCIAFKKQYLYIKEEIPHDHPSSSYRQYFTSINIYKFEDIYNLFNENIKCDMEHFKNFICHILSKIGKHQLDFIDPKGSPKIRLKKEEKWYH